MRTLTRCFVHISAVMILLGFLFTPGNTQADEIYQFSYDFQSGARLTGTFSGRITQSSGLFSDTVTVLPSPATATFDDGQGTNFSWDTSLPSDVTSQASLISPGEFAFVSFDGSKMDFVFSSGFPAAYEDYHQVLLENGIQQGPLNNASTQLLLPVDLVEDFVPANWSLTTVPEPQSPWTLCVSIFLLIARQCSLGESRRQAA